MKREKGNDVFPNLLKLNKILGFVFSRLSFFIPTTTTISGNQSPSALDSSIDEWTMLQFNMFLATIILALAGTIHIDGFTLPPHTRQNNNKIQHHHNQPEPALSSSSSLILHSTENDEANTSIKAPPRTGIAQTLLNMALESPLWKLLLVPQARNKIVSTAQANGIPWTQAKAWIMEQHQQNQQQQQSLTTSLDKIITPSYYQRPFHAYEDGNLSWEAAYEVELASCAVGARNFPLYGYRGEDAFRNAFANALQTEAGAVTDKDIDCDCSFMILDMGCGTGMSTRRLAQQFPTATAIHGVDLSPYFCEIGRQLLQLAPRAFWEDKNNNGAGTWVSTIVQDARIQYTTANAADTPFDDNTFDVVNLQFVLHELPPAAAREIVQEAYRVLKPGGQLWICEMDFEAPAYAAQRANALLFSLIRSTEPYLDEYAESISDLFQYLTTLFERTTVAPATGRHFVVMASKGQEALLEGRRGELLDLRFSEDGSYRVEDTHLKVWESKQDEVAV